VFALIGGGCSNATFAAREAIETAKIPTVVFASVHDGFTVPLFHGARPDQLTRTVVNMTMVSAANPSSAPASKA
jgi:branched-chain amino acid transport system substrate-binding protein